MRSSGPNLLQVLNYCRLHVHDILRKRCITELFSHFLPLSGHPRQEVLNDLTLLGVLRRLRNQEPSEADDGVGVLAWSIRNRDPEVRRHFRGGRCGGGAFERGLDVVAGRVLHRAVWNLVLYGVDQLNVSDRALDVADITGNALVALAAHTALPRDAGSLAD